MDKNHCQTTLIIGGKETLRFKRKFGSLDSAIKNCKFENAKDKQIRKLVSYKCTVCHHYHIGRGKTIITTKYRNKLKKELSEVNFKIIGKIKL